MRVRRHVASRSQPGLLLAAVLVAAMAVAGCGPSVDEGPWPEKVAKAKLLSALASASVEPVTSAAPPVVTPPTPAPSPPSAATDAPPLVAPAPVRLQIPSIGVDSELIALGLEADGTLEVPSSGFPAGWYTGAPAPGGLGPAIIAGHVDWDGRPGVFYDLRGLSAGDDIAITRHDGSTARFRVTRVDQFDKDAFPTESVYGDIDHAGLRLITCAGAFDPAMRSYDDNLVVFAELVDVTPA